VDDQRRQVEKLMRDVQLLEHERDKAQRESSSLRDELRAAESRNAVSSFSDFGAANELQKLRENTKKLELQRDLANQRCDNADAKLKAVEGCHL